MRDENEYIQSLEYDRGSDLRQSWTKKSVFIFDMKMSVTLVGESTDADIPSR